jgi:hypothetical protein
MGDDDDRVYWAILDSLSDDFEAAPDILDYLTRLGISLSRFEIEQRLQELITRGSIRHHEADSKVYGLTTVGAATWETLGQTFSDEPIDWSKAWTLDVDMQEGKGSVTGVSMRACEIGVSQITRLLGVSILEGTSRHEIVPGFWAKYYKWIDGGHRISFEIDLTAA